MARKKSAPHTKNGQPDISSLTDRQRRILEVIYTATKLKGYSPSIREIGDAAGLSSTSSVAYQLRILEQKGFLRREPHTPRAFDIRCLDSALSSGSPKKSTPESSPDDKNSQIITVPTTSDGQQAPAPVYIPVVGSIAAGTPTIAEENITDYVPFSSDLGTSGDLFLLKVTGVSMQAMGILKGDFVIVRQQTEVNSGDIIVAAHEGSDDSLNAQVKECRIDHLGRLWLIPHYLTEDDPQGDKNEPFRADDAVVIGKVIAVFRDLS